MIPKHGKIDCRLCFGDSDKKKCSPSKDWLMKNDPGAWGGNTPEYLVLGFSKGYTQADIYESGKFEDVAFAGARNRLTDSLCALGVLNSDEKCDDKINNPESNFSFGSLVRCGVSRKDKKGKYSCSGALICKSFKEIHQVINNCTEKYLTDLPDTVKAVIFLGISNPYIRSCQKRVKELYPEDFEKINSVACKADGRLWIHITHPSGANAYFDRWMKNNDGVGEKRIKAVEALKQYI